MVSGGRHRKDDDDEIDVWGIVVWMMIIVLMVVFVAMTLNVVFR